MELREYECVNRSRYATLFYIMFTATIMLKRDLEDWNNSVDEISRSPKD